MFEAFAGIGSQHRALENIGLSMGWEIKVVGIIEWFTYAIVGYVSINDPKFIPKKESFTQISDISNDSKNVITNTFAKKLINSELASYLKRSQDKYNNLFNIENITWKNIPRNIDIFTYSFPCQDLSTQGLQKGINKDIKTRSGLIWKIEKILLDMKSNIKSEQMPKYLLMENVKNLVSPKNLNNYSNWINSLFEIGYSSKSYILNSKNFSLPQNRERVFLLSIRNDYKDIVDFKFPEFSDNTKKISLSSILDEFDKRYIPIKNKSSNWKTMKSGVIKKELIDFTKFNSENFVFNPNGIGPTLTASGANSRIKIEINNKYRYLNSGECLKYMGFNESDYQLMKKTKLLPDSKITFLAGNSIPVNVLEAIFKSLVFKK